MIILKKYRSGIIYLGGNFIVALVNFGIIPFLTLHLTPEEFGRVGIYMLLVTIFSSLIGFDSLSALTRRIFDDKDSFENRAQLTSACILITLVTAIFLAVLASISLEISPSAYELMGGYGLLLSAVLAGIMSNLIKVQQAHWRIDGKSISFVLAQIVNPVLAAILTLFFIVFFIGNANSRILSLIISSFIVAIFCIITLYRAGYIRYSYIEIKKVRSLLTYGVSLMPHSIGLILVSSFDRMFVAGSLSLSQFGIYTLANQIASVVSLFLDGINNAIVPTMFAKLECSKSPSESRQRLQKLISVSYFFPLMMCIVICFIIASFRGSFQLGSYAAVVEPSAILLVAFSLLSPIYVLTNIALFHDRTKELSLITFVSGALSLIIVIILTKYFGINGAAASAVIGFSLRLCMLQILVLQENS